MVAVAAACFCILLTDKVLVVVEVGVVEDPTVALVEPADLALPANWTVGNRQAAA
jgi:hypothetical protein